MTNTPCRYCAATRTICFWGEIRQYEPWRRTVCLWCSIALTILFGGVSFLIGTRPPWILWLLTVPMLLVSLLGILVALNGCERCVVRMYGDGL